MSDSDHLLKNLLLQSVLWMIFGFSIWFYTGGIHVVPVVRMLEFLFSNLLGDEFYNVIQNPDNMLYLVVQTRIEHIFPDGSSGALGIPINPLIYGYGLPLLFGLTMGTDTLMWRKLAQLSAGLGAMWLVQTWGVFWEVLKNLSYAYGSAVHQVVQDTGISDVVIALCYQVGYLILPALFPVLIWVLFNRKFVEQLTYSKKGQ